MLEVDGGWLRWNEKLQQCDANCRFFCKLNWCFARGVLGLQLASLSVGIDEKHPLLENSKWLSAAFILANTGAKAASQRRLDVLRRCVDDIAVTKMTAVEARVTLLVPEIQSKHVESPTSEISVETPVETWQEWVQQDPKVARAICNKRGM